MPCCRGARRSGHGVFPVGENGSAAVDRGRPGDGPSQAISKAHRNAPRTPKEAADPVGSTATTTGARDHARAQAGTIADTQPTVPASSLADPPPGVAAADVLWDEVIGAGGYATQSLPRGTRIRLVDVDGDACAGVMVHRADHPAERLNVADTVKLQWQAYPGPGYLLAVRHGPGAGLGDRGHLRQPRHVLRHLQRHRQRGPLRRRLHARAHAGRPRPAGRGPGQARPGRARPGHHHQPVQGRVRRGGRVA